MGKILKHINLIIGLLIALSLIFLCLSYVNTPSIFDDILEKNKFINRGITGSKLIFGGKWITVIDENKVTYDFYFKHSVVAVLSTILPILSGIGIIVTGFVKKGFKKALFSLFGVLSIASISFIVLTPFLSKVTCNGDTMRLQEAIDTLLYDGNITSSISVLGIGAILNILICLVIGAIGLFMSHNHEE